MNLRRMLLALAAVATWAVLARLLWRYPLSAQDAFAHLDLAFVMAAALATTGLTFAPPLWQARALLAASTLLLGLYACEAWLYLTDRVGPRRSIRYRVAAAQANGRPIDARTSLEFIADRQRQGDHDLVPLYVPAGQPPLQVDGQPLLPLAGLSHRRTLSGHEADGWQITQTDRHGFRNPDTVWDVPHLDLLLLGDSFTWGAEVPDAATFAARLRQHHPQTLNLGHPGASPLGELAALVEYGAEKRPQWTLLFWFEGNDFEDLQHDLGQTLPPRYLAPGFAQHLVTRQPQIDAAVLRRIAEGQSWPPLQQFIPAFLQLRGLRSLLQWPSYMHAGRPEARIRATLDTTVVILTRLRDIVATWQGHVAIVYLPAWGRGRDATHVDARLVAGREVVQQAADRVGTPVVDTTPAFAVHPQQPPLLSLHPFPAGHYSRAGHGIVAQVVLDYLTQQGLPESP